MEKKKLLLVAVSVGVFLMIVIGLSILIFLPRNKESVAVSRVVSKGTPVSPVSSKPEASPPREIELLEPATVDAVDMLRNRNAIQGLQSPPPPSAPKPETGNKPGGNNGSNLVIEVQRPATVAVPYTDSAGRGGSSAHQGVAPAPAAPPPLPSVEYSVPSPNPSPSPAVSKPRTPPPQPPAVAPAPAPTPASVKPPPQSSKTYEDYWVQTGAFSTQIKAEDAKDILASKGITAIIENRDVKGQNLFRVRVGPYTSQNEANYWLARIKTINGFEGSMVLQSQSQR